MDVASLAVLGLGVAPFSALRISGEPSRLRLWSLFRNYRIAPTKRHQLVKIQATGVYSSNTR